MTSLVVNMIAGPGSGKSSLAAGVFAALKFRGVQAELVTEYVKEKVWEEHWKVLEHQIYIFGKQLYRMARLVGKVDVIVTDCPLILQLYYSNDPLLHALVLQEHHKFSNVNYYIERIKPYVESGRMQKEHEAKAIDKVLKQILKEHKVPFTNLLGQESSIDIIASDVIWHLKKLAR